MLVLLAADSAAETLLLSQVREIAPEFYNTLNYRTSWSKVIYDYITNPRMGPYNRTKRLPETRFAKAKAQ